MKINSDYTLIFEKTYEDIDLCINCKSNILCFNNNINITELMTLSYNIKNQNILNINQFNLSY